MTPTASPVRIDTYRHDSNRQGRGHRRRLSIRVNEAVKAVSAWWAHNNTSQATSQAVEQVYYIYNRISEYMKKKNLEVGVLGTTNEMYMVVLWSVTARPPAAVMLNLLPPSAPEILPFLHKAQLIRLLRNKTKGIYLCGLDGGAGLDPLQDHLCIVDLARSNLWVGAGMTSQVRLEIFLAVSPPWARRMRAVKPEWEMSR